jgi:trimeric autotransporter adhesin
MGIYSEAIQRLYVAYFNRPADPAGLDYWEKAVAAANGSTTAVSSAFASSSEYQTAYANLDYEHVVNQVYVNLFGHGADAAGLDFWVKALSGKAMTVSDAVTQIAGGAQGGDQVAFQSKTKAAAAFSGALDTVQEALSYSGDRPIQIAKAFLAGVTDDATLQAAIAPDALQKVIDSLSGQAPRLPINLTTGADILVGSAGDDVFNAYPFDPATGLAAVTLSPFDSVDGGGGKDVLNITIEGGRNTSFGTIKNIETINITADLATAVDASAFQGATMLRQIGRAASVLELSASTTAAFQGNTISGNLDVHAAGASATVFFESVSESATLSVSGNLLNTVSVSGSRVHPGSGLSAALNLSLTAGKDVQSVSLNTDQATSLTITEDSASVEHVTSLNATRSTGSIVFNATKVPHVNSIITGAGDDVITADKLPGKALSIQTGAGDDRIYLNGAPESGDVIDGGAGTNTLIISGVDATEGIAISKLVKNFSAVQFVYPLTGASLDASLLSKSYGVIEMSNGGSVSNVTTQSLVAYGDLTATAAGYTAKTYGGGLHVTQKANGLLRANGASLDATVQASSSDVHLTLGGDLQSANVALAGENGKLASIGVNTDVLGVVAVRSLTLSGNGTASVVNTDDTKMVVIDASSLSGGLTYSSANQDAETIRLGSGADHLTFSTTTSTYASMDSVYGLALSLNANGTGLAAGSDTLMVLGVATTVKLFTTTQTDVDLALKEAAASSRGDDLVFALGGDTYIYHDTGSNNLVDSSDILVKLVGVTDTRAVIIALGGAAG